MIDSIVFFGDADPNTPANLNDVVNGTGTALKRFEAHYDTRLTDQARPFAPGMILNPFQSGKMVVELEGDIMGSTAALYWAERNKLAAAVLQGQQWPKKAGRLQIQFTGFSELISNDVHPISPPQMPIGLAGSTITPWMMVFGLNDEPWFKSYTVHSQVIGPAVTVALTNFGLGNAPSWPTFTITGPITNPSILWQGSAFITISTNLGAGATISVNMRDRIIRGGSGTNYYNNSNIPSGFIWFDARTVAGSGKNVRLNGTGTTGATTLQIQYQNSYII